VAASVDDIGGTLIREPASLARSSAGTFDERDYFVAPTRKNRFMDGKQEPEVVQAANGSTRRAAGLSASVTSAARVLVSPFSAHPLMSQVPERLHP
jgi:hypothetical protein